MNPRRRHFAGATLLVLIAASALRAQPEAEPRFEGEVTVSEVLLDVIVTDRQGNVILGLGPDDFDVREGGKPVKVRSAGFYSHRAPAPAVPPGIPQPATPPGSSTSEGGEPASRFLILFFDDQRTRALEARGLLQRQVRAGKDTIEFLRRAMTPNDWVAVLSYDKKLHLVADFTRDRQRIEAAVSAATAGGAEGANWPSRQTTDEGEPSLGRSLPTGDALRDQSGTIYEALTIVAEAARTVVGRKNLLFFSTGFGRVNRFGAFEPDPRYYEPMAESLNDANVAVYALDLSPTGTEHTLAGSLTQVSDDTGGDYFREILHFATPLEEVARATSGYYLVSYDAPHPTGVRGFQPVEVRLKNPELRVTARKGYRFGE
jgi:VWFA-related protein